MAFFRKTTKSRWTRRNRANCDSVLFLKRSSSQHVTIGHDSKYDFEHTDSFSIAICYEPIGTIESSSGAGSALLYKRNSSLQGYGLAASYPANGLPATHHRHTFIINHNGTNSLLHGPDIRNDARTYTVATYNGSNKACVIYVNGRQVASATLNTPAGTIKTTLDISIGRYAANTTTPLQANAYIHQSAIFNKVLTAQEVEQMHKAGNVLPASTHASCVGHWVAEKIGKTMPDKVADYNYAKGTALSANNGSLINYTDTEVGLVNYADQTAYYHFYTRQRFTSL
jgi:hypothetical protein